MEYENNGLKGAICDILRLSGIVLFGGWEQKYKQPKFTENAAQEDLYQRLLTMVDEGELNAAENELIEYAEQQLLGNSPAPETGEKQKKATLEMALCVYGYMNDKEDAFLENNDFSREEIEEGIQTMLRRYGAHIPDIGDRNV